MAGSDDMPNQTKVVLAAQALISQYGDGACERAKALLERAAARSFAVAVHAEVATRLSRPLMKD